MMMSKGTFALCLVFATFGSSAQGKKVLDGCYIPTAGFAKSINISDYEQLGHYNIVLVHEDWEQLSGQEKRRIQRRKVIRGPFQGEIVDFTSDGYPLLNHTLSTYSRDGYLRTYDDIGVPDGEVLDCFEPDPETGVPKILSLVETLYIEEGFGIFAHVQYQAPGDPSTIVVKGIVNNCPTEEVKKNDFRVVDGRVCFDDPDEPYYP